jgi:hypothetical protein
MINQSEEMRQEKWEMGSAAMWLLRCGSCFQDSVLRRDLKGLDGTHGASNL